MKNEIFEIERKFLVKELPEGLENSKKLFIKQAYISTDPTIRLRQQNDEYILTVKGSGLMKKVEYELPLEKEQFENLWKKIDGNVIVKTRYRVLLENNLIAELDIYDDFLKGFMNVEVEFSSTKEALLFEPPTWFGQEVTQNKEYSNASLAKFGKPKNI